VTLSVVDGCGYPIFRVKTSDRNTAILEIVNKSDVFPHLRLLDVAVI
jgi:hypothetical protein